MTVDELLSSIEEYRGEIVDLNGVITAGDDDNMYFVRDYDCRDEISQGVFLSHPNLYKIVRKAGVPIRVPHGILYRAQARGTVAGPSHNAPVRLENLEFLSVRRVTCIEKK